jgi:hypothetical protein
MATPNLKLRHQAAGKSRDVELEGGGDGSSASLEERRTLNPFPFYSSRIVRYFTRPTAAAFSHNRTTLPDNFIAECISITLLRILPAAAVLVGLPLVIWDAHPQNWGVFNLWPLLRHVDLVWSSLLHFSIWPIVVLIVMVIVVLPIMSTTLLAKKETFLRSLLVNISQSNWKVPLTLSILIASTIAINMGLQMGMPSSLWNPFIWGRRYQVYLPGNVVSSLGGACLDVNSHISRQPLCLSESKWNELSSGKLSSLNREDVQTVQRGLDYLRNQSGGLIVNCLARDVADSIPALKQNMDGLAPFFKDSHNKLSLVVFENDSDDGTRRLFKQWAEKESSYAVDIIGCGPTNPDCKLGEMDRYDKMNLFKNPNASGVGKLGQFRQIILEYILGKEEYNDFSHMIVLDVDLGISISPLGLLHTLGLEHNIAEEYVVASSSVQIWAGGMGTIIPPYDFAAFRAKSTEINQKVRGLHTSFCHLMPPGDRWRNMCHAASPMQLFMIMQSADATYNHEKPHEVESAFNGLTIYPMSLIRSRGKAAQYDAGDDNQRCEHVGFNLSLRKTMYVNPKWRMNLKPSRPGGPTGSSAISTMSYAVIGRPTVMFAIVVAIVVSILVFCTLFVCSLWVIGVSIKSLLVWMYVNE